MIVYESVIDSTTEEIKVKCFGLRNRVLNKGSVIAKVWIMPLRKAIRWSFAGKSILAGLCKEYPKRLEPTYTAEYPGVTIFTPMGGLWQSGDIININIGLNFTVPANIVVGRFYVKSNLLEFVRPMKQIYSCNELKTVLS